MNIVSTADLRRIYGEGETAVHALKAPEVAYDLAGATHDEYFAYQFRLGDARMVLFDHRREPAPRELVISKKRFGDSQPGARLVFPERYIDQALWAVPGYVCHGDSGGAIFLDALADRSSGGDRLVANVSDGGNDCRSHNNNHRLDTARIQSWIDEAISEQFGERP